VCNYLIATNELSSSIDLATITNGKTAGETDREAAGEANRVYGKVVILV